MKYTSQGIPAEESIQHFCDRNKVPYNLFDKWYRDTRHKVVKVSVDSMPTTDTDSGSSLMGSIIDEIKPQDKLAEREPEWNETRPQERQPGVTASGTYKTIPMIIMLSIKGVNHILVMS